MNDPLPRCTRCGNSMRPRNTRAADWPGTVPRSSPTECMPCRQRDHRVAERAELGRIRRRHPHKLEPDELQAHPGLASLIRARRRRGIPAEGTQAA